MPDASKMRTASSADLQHPPVRRPEQQTEETFAADETALETLQRMASGPLGASPAGIRRLQRSIGNRAVGRALTRNTTSATLARLFAPGGAVLQRALLAKMSAAPAYSDALTLPVIHSTALDKPPRPKKEGADWTGKLNADARKVFKVTLGITDQALFDANLGDSKLLQAGEVHGNQEYKNKSNDLPGGTTYKEYDTAKYGGDPRLRGGDRVVTGADGKNYYTGDHYKNFAEF